MKRQHRSLLTAALLLLFAAAAWAERGREFVAAYAVTNVVEVGDDVVLTFSADVFNFSGKDVPAATVELRGASHPGDAYASFPAVTIPDRAHLRLTAEVTVPAEELDAWQRGIAPRLTIEYLDAAGQSRLAAAETSRALLAEEQP